MNLIKQTMNENKADYFVSIVFSILGVSAGLFVYVFLSKVIVALLTGQNNPSFYVRNVGYIMLLLCVKEIMAGISTIISHKATFGIIRNIRKTIVAKLFRVPLGDVLAQSTGTLKDIIVTQVANMEPTLAHLIPELSANLVGPVLLLIYMLRLDWRLTLLSLVPFVIGLVFMSGPMKRTPKRFAKAVQIGQAMNNSIVEYINGIEVVKTFNQGERSYKKYNQNVSDKANYYYEWMSENTTDYAISMTIAPIGILTIIPFGLYFCMQGTLDGARLITLIVLSFATVKNIMSVMSFSDDIGRISTTLKEINKILELEELENVERGEPVKSHAIELNSVHFSYEAGEQVLNDLQLVIREGSVSALVGPSGSGKSTIAKLIAGFWNVDSGEIKIGGVNTKQMSLERLSSLISYVSQDNFLFDISVRDNIRIGKKDATDKEVGEIAKKSGCHDFIMTLSNGYDTIVGDSGGRLSGGERQRISIARAMLKDAPIVILDEATSYIDPENEAIVQDAISKLVKGKTLLIIAHRLKTITDVDKIFVISAGRVESSGTHTELLETSPLYREMFNAALKGEAE